MMVTVAAVLLLAGCSNEDEIVSSPNETYFGRYTAGKLGVSGHRVDSVALIIGNGTYTMFMEAPIHDIGGAICGTTGKVTGFTGRYVTFTPNNIVVANCSDTLRVPNGTFYAIYNGNSVTMTDTSYITYQFQRNGNMVTVTDTILLVFELTR